MKKIIICCFALFTATTIKAQTVNVHFKNGQIIEYPADNVNYVDFSEKSTEPTVTAGQVVDLGLSVYWASCNVGADSPEDYGYYYAWGETKPKSSYTKDNYSYYDNNTQKYINIGENICGTNYDAATVNLGSDWRLPSKDEMLELINNCTWEWIQMKGVNGFKISANNGNSIFLPAAGKFLSGPYHQGWTSYLTGEAKFEGKGFEHAYTLYVQGTSSPKIDSFSNPIEWGYTIRPVTSNPNAGGNSIDHSKDYLVTDKISASFAGGAYTSINGRIGSGSQLSWRFSNNSSESVTLTGLQLIDGASGNEGNNLLNEQVEVPANSNKAYTITVGIYGVINPRVRFTYLYNKKKYTVEASMPD